MVKNFGQILENLFVPLFEATLDPSSHPFLSKFLNQVQIRDLSLDFLNAFPFLFHLPLFHCLCQSLSSPSLPLLSLSLSSRLQGLIVWMMRVSQRVISSSRRPLTPPTGRRPITHLTLITCFTCMQTSVYLTG